VRGTGPYIWSAQSLGSCSHRIRGGQSLSHALAEEQWQYEAETARGGYFKRHTLFFIPMHYFGVLTGLAAP
jgi:hypothetical protein